MRFRYVWSLACVVAVSLAAWTVVGQTKSEPPKAAEKKPDRKKAKELMAQKSTHSAKVLEALMKNDLTAAGKAAEELIRIRKEAAWFIVKTDVYTLWSDQFTICAEKLVKAAKEKNAELAKLAYLELTMVCFNCHAYSRDMGYIADTKDN